MRLLIMLALLPSILIGCHRGNKKNPVAAATEAAKDTDLQRTWSSECSAQAFDSFVKGHAEGIQSAAVVGMDTLQQGTQGQPQQQNPAQPAVDAARAAQAAAASMKSVRVFYEFKGNAVTRTTVYYSKPDCAKEAWIYEETGNFKIDEKQKTNDGGKYIDLDLRSLTVRVRDQEGADVANALKLCAKSNWAANSKKEDATKQAKEPNCYGTEVPRKIQTVYRIDSDTLYLGAPVAQAGQRPDRVAFDRPLRKR